MAFSQVQTLVGDIAAGSFEFGYGTTGAKFYFVSKTGGDKIYEYDPVTNVETMVVQQSTLTAIKADSSAPATFRQGFRALALLGMGGNLYFTSYDTVIGKAYIWKFTPATSTVSLEFSFSIPTAASPGFGSPILWVPTFLGLIFNYGHAPEGYATYFKPSAGSSFRKASDISGLTGVVDVNGQSSNPDTRYPEPFYTTAAQSGTNYLLRWSGSSWAVIDSSYTGAMSLLYGPNHYWSVYPPHAGPAAKGTWTDDFATFTAVGGSQNVLGGRMLNMPWEVGNDLGSYYRYDSSLNEWVAWCTGPAHQAGVTDPFIMWKTDDGDMYLFYAPSSDDWRVAKLTAGTCLNPPGFDWDSSSSPGKHGLYTSHVDFTNPTVSLLSHVRTINQYGSIPMQRLVQVGLTDESVYLGNALPGTNDMVARLLPPYIGAESDTTDDEDLTDSIDITTGITGVDHTDAI